jgi:DNA-binding transcriptional ArsR family regulator
MLSQWGHLSVASGEMFVATWSFLTNHALVLTHIGQRPDSTGLEISQAVGITERAVRKILADLQEAGYIEPERIGRRNRYRVDVHRPLQQVGGRRLTVGELLAFIPEDVSHNEAADGAGS